MVGLSWNGFNRLPDVGLFILVTFIRFRPEEVLGIRHVHRFVQSFYFLREGKSRLLHGPQLGLCGHKVSLDPLAVISELPDGSLPPELLGAVARMVEILVLVEDQAYPARVGSVWFSESKKY